MGLDEAKTGRRFTDAEAQAARQIMNEAMDAGACGWSLQHLGGTSIQTRLGRFSDGHGYYG